MRDSASPPVSPQRGGLDEGFTLRIVLFQRSFPDHPKANMGMIAYEVAHCLLLTILELNRFFKPSPMVK